MIYLDITTTKKYCGLNPVGIVRCEIESLNYILAHEELPAKFCYFSKAENKFIVIGRDEAAKIVSLVGSPKADFPPANNTQQNIPVSGESSQVHLCVILTRNQFIKNSRKRCVDQFHTLLKKLMTRRLLLGSNKLLLT